MNRRSLFYTRLLPLIWASCSLLHFLYPGDEYGLYAMGSIVGTWIVVLFRFGDIHNPLFPVSIALAGAAVMAGFGYLMDRLKVKLALWISLFLAAFVVVLVRSLLAYPSIEEAMNKNGSWLAYICFAFNIGLYMSVVLSLLEQSGRIAWKRFRSGRQEQQEEKERPDQEV